MPQMKHLVYGWRGGGGHQNPGPFNPPGTRIPSGSPPGSAYLHIFLHLLLLVSELAKSVNDQTCGGTCQSVPNLCPGSDSSLVWLPTSEPCPIPHLPHLTLLPTDNNT